MFWSVNLDNALFAVFSAVAMPQLSVGGWKCWFQKGLWHVHSLLTFFFSYFRFPEATAAVLRCPGMPHGRAARPSRWSVVLPYRELGKCETSSLVVAHISRVFRHRGSCDQPGDVGCFHCPLLLHLLVLCWLCVHWKILC